MQGYWRSERPLSTPSRHNRLREFRAFAGAAMIRPISNAEASVLENVLRVGAVGILSPEVVTSVRRLHVTATCKCGCATVWFGPKGDAANGNMAAEACGTWNGEAVDLIVWCIGEQIIGLEVVGADSPGLPDPVSVRSLDQWFQTT